MSELRHTLFPEHLPSFMTAPGETDVLMVITGAILLLFAVAVGVLYFRLHHLPEHLASKSQKVQYEIVAVLGLLAMFTHEHLFWIAGLLLAFIDIPDFGNLFGRIARAAERIARIKTSKHIGECNFGGGAVVNTRRLITHSTWTKRLSRQSSFALPDLPSDARYRWISLGQSVDSFRK